jgi:hypothetical protein
MVTNSVLEKHATTSFTFTLDMDSVHYFISVITIYEISWHHSLGDETKYFCWYEDLRSYKGTVFWSFFFIAKKNTTNLEIAKLPCVDFVMQGVQVLADQLMSQERDVQN